MRSRRPRPASRLDEGARADTGGQPYGTPSRFEAGIIRNIPKGLKQYTSASTRTPLQDLDGILTPNGLF